MTDDHIRLIKKGILEIGFLGVKQMEVRYTFKSETDLAAVVLALRVAREVYQEDARVMEGSALNRIAKDRLVRQFEDQAEHVRRLADEIEERHQEEQDSL